MITVRVGTAAEAADAVAAIEAAKTELVATQVAGYPRRGPGATALATWADKVVERSSPSTGTAYYSPVEIRLVARVLRATPEEQARMWLRDELTPALSEIVEKTPLVKAALAKRRARGLERQEPSLRCQCKRPGCRLMRRISEREPGGALERHLRQIACRVIVEANFREASHAHEWTVDVVPRGEESATSTADQISARSAGMSNAYCKKAFTVASSNHKWRVSPAMLGLPHGTGVVYLTPTRRVRQGRGTLLVEERLVAGATGKLKWEVAP